MLRAAGMAACALCAAVATSSCAQPLDAARAAFALGQSEEAARLAAPWAAAGQVEALALMGLIARDSVPPDVRTARALLDSAAESGSATALVALGRAHQSGQLGLRADPGRALAFFERAVRAGSRVAEVNVIGLVAQGSLGDPDWAALQDRLADLAQAQVPGAAALLSEMLATGRGGRLDPTRARAIAAASADAGAMRILGWMMIQGVGGAADLTGGRALLRRAALAGHGPAATDLGLLFREGQAGLRRDRSEARRWFERAAGDGDGWGATHLARLLSDGDSTVPDDPARAFRLYQAGDARGIAAATHGLATAHWDGIGTQAAPVTARRLMERAAVAGFPRAINDLGVMVETGIGGAADPDRAAELYAAAARAGEALGAWNRAGLLLDRSRAPTDPAEGYAWCLWAEANAPDPATRTRYRDGCAALVAGLSAGDRARGAARFSDSRPRPPDPAAAP